MTLREYITDKLQAFGVTEAGLVDLSLSSGLSLDADIAALQPSAVGAALAKSLEELILAPRLSNASESGFSLSWDFGRVAQYYLWLCRKWGLTPEGDVLASLGLSVIADRTSKW